MTLSDRRSRLTNRCIGVLDAGSFKTVCLIATLDSEGQPARIAGVGHVPSAGIKSGVIVDLAAAERTIRAAIASAERMAGVRLSEIDIAVSGGGLTSHAFQAAIPLPSGVVTRQDVVKLAGAGRSYAERSGRRLLDLTEWGYRLDGGEPAIEPIGMAARRLAADLHAVTADLPAISNLTHTIERCYLVPGRLIPGPIASALAVTSADERRDGVIVLDIGAAVTGIAAFRDGRTICAESVAVGRGHLTHHN